MAEYVYESKPTIIDQQRSLMLRVAGVGVVLGLSAWALTYVLERFVLSSLLCGEQGPACASSTAYAGGIATVIIAIVGVAVLVRLTVYRPLLIAIGVAISLWGLATWLVGLGVLESVGWTILLYVLGYLAYAWLARIRNVPVMLVLVALLVIATRVVPNLV